MRPTLDHPGRSATCFALLALLALGTTPAAAQVAAAEPDPIRERFVAFSRDWMPIVRVGYLARFTLVRGTSLSRGENHGLTSDVLVPLVATGRHDSLARLALVTGAGVDFTAQRYTPAPPLDDESSEPPAREVARTVVAYGQLGVLVRVRRTDASRGGVGFEGSLVWQPSRRYVVDVSRRGLLQRGRLSLGLCVGPWRVAAFVGVGAFDEVRTTVDVGLHVGAGW